MFGLVDEDQNRHAGVLENSTLFSLSAEFGALFHTELANSTKPAKQLLSAFSNWSCRYDGVHLTK